MVRADREVPRGAARTYAPRMRDIATIDGELRLLARAWRETREMTGCTPSTALIDRLHDERAASSAVNAQTG